MTGLIPPVASTCDPRFTYRSWFTGAVLPVCGVEILIVVVQPRIMVDAYEANLYVAAFNLRFRRTTVLMSQADQTLVPTYYGPAGIVQVLSRLPFEVIPWQRMLYRIAKPAPWQLPIPPERSPHDSDKDPHTSDTGRYDSSIGALAGDLTKPRIRDPDRDDLRALAERMSRSTRR